MTDGPGQVIDVRGPAQGSLKALTQKVGGYVITAVLTGALGAIGGYFTLQQKTLENERRIARLEDNTASKEQMKQMLDTIIDQNRSIDARMGHLESAIMSQRNR